MRWPGLTVFDLDDTLYLERDFVRSGFAAAGRWFEQEHRRSGLAEACLSLFEAGCRQRIFDEALRQFDVPADPAMVSRLVGIYRGHEPDIALAADAERYLSGRAGRVPCALITDGPLVTQQAKVRALGLETRLGCILCTGALGPGRGKPHPEAFERVEAWAGAYGMPLAYIADNPLKDFVTPRSRGWLTVQIERPERVHHAEAPDAAHAAHGRIDNLDQLDTCLVGLQDTVLASVRTFPTDVPRRLPIS